MTQMVGKVKASKGGIDPRSIERWIFAIPLLAITLVPFFVFANTGTGEVQSPDASAHAASSQWSAESRRHAIELFKAASDAWIGRLEPRKAADELRNAASIALELREFEAARDLFQRAISIERREQYTEGEIISHSRLTELEIRAGNDSVAESELDTANRLQLAAAYPEADAARSFANAELQYSRFKMPETITFASRARELWMLSGNTDRQIEANGLIAYAHAALYEPLDAENLANESLELARKSGNKRAEAITLAQKAFVLTLMNEPIKALDLCKTAERMFPEGVDLGEQAQLANGIGGIYWLLGDLRTSHAYSQKAFDLFGRDRSPRGQLATLVSLIDLSFALGDSNQAFEYHRQANSLSKQLNNDYFIAIADRFVANHYLNTGDPDTAIRYYERILTRLTQSGFKSGISSIHSNLGEAYFRKNDLKQARIHFEAAQELNHSVSDRFAESQSLFDLARLSKAGGDLGASTKLVGEAIAVTESLRDKVVNQRIRSEYFATINERYAFAIGAFVHEGRDAESFRLAERGRAREVIENLTVAHAGIFADADELIVARERSTRVTLNAKADKLTDLLRRGGTGAERSALENEIGDLQYQLEQIRAEIKEKSPEYSAIKDLPEFDVSDFQASVLGENDALLEYFFGKDESYLWLVGRNDFAAFALPGREEIESKIDELLGLLDARRPLANETSQQFRDRVAATDARFGPAARELSNIILGPVAGKLAGKRIIVVPDGKLHYFGISALPLPNSNSDDPILLTNEVVYQPSAQTLSLLTKFRSNAGEKRKRDLLVFSDPVFGRDDARLEGVEAPHAAQQDETLNLRFAESLEGLQRLPASGREAETIANIVGSRGTDIFTGFGATRDQLLASQLSDYKIIHLATHGLINHDRPDLSAVILSRFDENGQPRDESVRLQDIYGMKLNADLVVLSACQTAAGKEIKGEGVMGLNSAFLQAGAHSVVASLWQVDDNATNLLMKEFYRGMANGRPVSAALRDAQLALYRDPQFRSPFFWAAFTLQGDMNRKPDIGSGLSAWWVGGLAAMIAVFGLVVWKLVGRRRRIKVSTQP